MLYKERLFVSTPYALPALPTAQRKGGLIHTGGQKARTTVVRE